jgi:hypothetical protein
MTTFADLPLDSALTDYLADYRSAQATMNQQMRAARATLDKHIGYLKEVLAAANMQAKTAFSAATQVAFAAAQMAETEADWLCESERLAAEHPYTSACQEALTTWLTGHSCLNQELSAASAEKLSGMENRIAIERLQLDTAYTAAVQQAQLERERAAQVAVARRDETVKRIHWRFDALTVRDLDVFEEAGHVALTEYIKQRLVIQACFLATSAAAAAQYADARRARIANW